MLCLTRLWHLWGDLPSWKVHLLPSLITFSVYSQFAHQQNGVRIMTLGVVRITWGSINPLNWGSSFFIKWSQPSGPLLKTLLPKDRFSQSRFVQRSIYSQKTAKWICCWIYSWLGPFALWWCLAAPLVSLPTRMQQPPLPRCDTTKISSDKCPQRKGKGKVLLHWESSDNGIKYNICSYKQLQAVASNVAT